MDESKARVGYEINFNRYFYKVPAAARPLNAIPFHSIEGDLKETGGRLLICNGGGDSLEPVHQIDLRYKIAGKPLHKQMKNTT